MRGLGIPGALAPSSRRELSRVARGLGDPREALQPFLVLREASQEAVFEQR